MCPLETNKIRILFTYLTELHRASDETLTLQLSNGAENLPHKRTIYVGLDKHNMSVPKHGGTDTHFAVYSIEITDNQ